MTECGPSSDPSDHSPSPWQRADEAYERVIAEALLPELHTIIGTSDEHWWHTEQLNAVEQTGRFPLWIRECVCGWNQTTPQDPAHSEHPHKEVVQGTMAAGV